MKTNMGSADRWIRLVLALGLIALFLAHMITGTLAIVLLIFAGIFILTSIVGTCPLYLPLGISTRKKERTAV